MSQLTLTGCGPSASPPNYWTFQVVTTAAGETFALQAVGVNAGKTCVVDWGDGSASQNWTGQALRSHVYAATGTYTVTVTNALEIFRIEMQDAKTLWTVSNAAPIPKNLTSLALYNLPNLTWDVGCMAGGNMPVNLTMLYLYNLTGLTWDVGSSVGANMPANLTTLTLNSLTGLTWDVGSSVGANMPANLTALTLNSLTGLTWDVGSNVGANMPIGVVVLNLIGCSAIMIDATDVLPKPLTIFRFENHLTQAQVDAVLAALYLAFPTRTGTNGTIDLAGGGNAAPSGTAPGSAQCPPATGWNTAYELVHDSCNVSPKHWASVTCQT